MDRRPCLPKDSRFSPCSGPDGLVSALYKYYSSVCAILLALLVVASLLDLYIIYFRKPQLAKGGAIFTFSQGLTGINIVTDSNIDVHTDTYVSTKINTDTNTSIDEH